MQQISTTYNYGLEVLEHLTKEHTSPVTLLICWERKDFFAQILNQVVQSEVAQLAFEIPSSQHSEEALQGSDSVPGHAFLTASLHLLSISKSIKLVYCPTVPTIRAYLANYTSDSVLSSQLIVLDLLALHHGISEFTLQGLSRTFASAVSAAHRSSSSLTLIECQDVNDLTNPHRGSRLWNVEVPLLSGSVKIGQEGTRWAGRSLSIKRVASRWFTFDQDGQRKVGTKHVVEAAEDEMLI